MGQELGCQREGGVHCEILGSESSVFRPLHKSKVHSYPWRTQSQVEEMRNKSPHREEHGYLSPLSTQQGGTTGIRGIARVDWFRLRRGREAGLSLWDMGRGGSFYQWMGRLDADMEGRCPWARLPTADLSIPMSSYQVTLY